MRRVVVPVSAEFLAQMLKLPRGFSIEDAAVREQHGEVLVLLTIESGELADVEPVPEVTPILVREPERFTWKIGEQEFRVL